MEDMLAAKNDRRLITKARNHAYTTVVLLGVILVELEVYVRLVVHFDAVFVEARQASTLTLETSALVAASVSFVATFIHFFNAFWLAAYVHEGRLFANRLLCKRRPAKTAL